ncbi:MAG: transketolase C-terminal domain-containing protein, partial [Spartobacteria bacterium]
EFASALAPGMIGGGFIFAIFILNREKVNMGKSITAVMVSSFQDGVFLAIMAPLVYFVVGKERLFSTINDFNLMVPLSKGFLYTFWAVYFIILAYKVFVAYALFINPRFIKPLDTAVLEKFARQCKVIATFEDHVLHNGFGCSVIEHLHEAGIHTPVIRLGWPDEFIEHGTVPILREKHGLTPGHAVARIKAQLEALGHRPSGAHLIAG